MSHHKLHYMHYTSRDYGRHLSRMFSFWLSFLSRSRSRSRCRHQPIGSFEMAFESVAIDSGFKFNSTKLASEGTNNMTRSRSGSIHFPLPFPFFAIRYSLFVSRFSFLLPILGASLILHPTFSTSLFQLFQIPSQLSLRLLLPSSQHARFIR